MAMGEMNKEVMVTTGMATKFSGLRIINLWSRMSSLPDGLKTNKNFTKMIQLCHLINVNKTSNI